MRGRALFRLFCLTVCIVSAGSILPRLTAEVLAGTHWPPTKEFRQVSRLGYEFVVATVGSDQADWKKKFDAAEKAGVQLIVGLHPPPYKLIGERWTISVTGVSFLRYAHSRARIVKAIFVYNEPYWVHPITDENHLCGALSASQLRNLRDTIRSVWPQARIYHDIGQPSAWAPGGRHRKEYACVGDKYANAAGVADYVTVWVHPFEVGKYDRDRGLRILSEEIEYVRGAMGAEPIVGMQAFHCSVCDPVKRFPTKEEVRDWNCAVRSLGPHGISWYPWRQDMYEVVLADHPEYWDATTAQTCDRKENLGWGLPKPTHGWGEFLLNRGQ